MVNTLLRHNSPYSQLQVEVAEWLGRALVLSFFLSLLVDPHVVPLHPTFLQPSLSIPPTWNRGIRFSRFNEIPRNGEHNFVDYWNHKWIEYYGELASNSNYTSMMNWQTGSLDNFEKFEKCVTIYSEDFSFFPGQNYIHRTDLILNRTFGFPPNIHVEKKPNTEEFSVIKLILKSLTLNN